MGLMMSVLVFSIGVLEALACVEHVRQSYLPLGLGRKRRRLVLDVGSGTIRHRETRRSSEFQRDPHVFLRSIQAAVEEEGDEKESEELEAIFQSMEAHHIHSTQIMNHQDPIFLTVNDIDENDSCASSEISRTSTPNTVIMNMSPVLDRESIVEYPNIPSDSFSDLLGPKCDEAFSNQKDISITQVDIGQFMCIRDHEYSSEAIVGNGPYIDDGVLQPSETQIFCIDSTVCTTSKKLPPNEKIEMDETIISAVNMYGAEVSSIRVNEIGEEISIEGCLLNNAMLTDTVKDEQPTRNNNEIDLNIPGLSKDGKDNINSKIINKNFINFESNTILQIPLTNNEICKILSETPAQNNGSIIRDNNSEINHKMKEESFNATNSSTAETNNTDTIEKCKILVKSQAHSGKEPLIENKGKDEICEAQLEPVVESEKHSKKDESQNSVVITNAVNNGSNNFIEYGKSEISLKQNNQPVQEILFHAAQLNESVPMKLDESEVIAEVIDGTLSNDSSFHRISKETETRSASEGKIAETSNDGFDVCDLEVAHDSQCEAAKLIPTRTDASNEFNKIIDLEIVNQDREINKETSNLIEVDNFNSLDSMRVCIDDNSNILKEICPDPYERKTKPENDQGNHKNVVPGNVEFEVLEEALMGSKNANGTNVLKAVMKGTQQELDSDDIVPNDSRSIKLGKEDVYFRNDVLEEKGSEEQTELNRIQAKETRTDISEEVVNIKEEIGSGKVEPVMKYKSKIFEETVRHITDVTSEDETLTRRNDFSNHGNTPQSLDSEEPLVIMDPFKTPNNSIPIESNQKEHLVDSIKEVDIETVHSLNDTVPSNNKNQDELIPKHNATTNEDDVAKKVHPTAQQPTKQKSKTQSNEEITSKDLLDVKESLKPLPQKEQASYKEGKPSDGKAVKKVQGVLAKQETLNVSPFPDDVTVMVGDLPSQNQFPAVEDITSPDKAFWLIFSGEYTKAMSKDWHSGHFCCWQCDESLTGQRYVLRDDHPYCIKCYEQVFANTCDECSKVIGIDSKDLSYKDKHWHEACFLCSKCRVSLVDKQFGSKADKIYCGNCYDAQFASRCDGCGQIFRAGTKKMEYKTRQWHEQCFCCCVCKTAIGTKSFIPREQEIYCATCYEEKFATRCVKCNKIITSGGVTYKNEPWHRECFTCTNCSTSLAGQRFTSRDEKPYCAECFGELFAKRCTACCKPITGIGGTRFISFEDRHWHNDCFICASCRSSLVGRGFITDAEDILCTECAKQKLM